MNGVSYVAHMWKVYALIELFTIAFDAASARERAMNCGDNDDYTLCEPVDLFQSER